MEFVLRKWEIQDVDSTSQYANNKKIAENLRDGFPHPYTEKDAENFIMSCIQADETRQFCRAIVVDGKAVGSIGIFFGNDVYRKSGELGYWLGEPFWNKGIMSKAIQQACTYVFENYDIVRIFAEPYAHNTGSRKALERCGFACEGILKNSVYKNGRILDSCIYALINLGKNI